MRGNPSIYKASSGFIGIIENLQKIIKPEADVANELFHPFKISNFRCRSSLARQFGRKPGCRYPPVSLSSAPETARRPAKMISKTGCKANLREYLAHGGKWQLFPAVEVNGSMKPELVHLDGRVRHSSTGMFHLDVHRDGERRRRPVRSSYAESEPRVSSPKPAFGRQHSDERNRILEYGCQKPCKLVCVLVDEQSSS
jgi:hypothetical protein